MRSVSAGLALAASLLWGGAACAEDPVGDWGGLLFGRLRVVFHVRVGPDGSYQATTESPDQLAGELPVDVVDAGPDHLDLTMSAVHARYSGRWDDEQRLWIGALTQGSAAPLALHRLGADELMAMKPKRPQDEAAALAMTGFSPEEVRIPNPDAPGVVLAGSFSKPPGAGPFPAVLLVAGSGRQTRDEEVARHKVFLVLAAELNRRGLAVLRYDKRGVGGSSGAGDAATTADYASDAAAAFRYLANRRDVDPRRAGLIGHSEGGAIASLTACRKPKPAFLVLMAGPGQRGAEMLLEQQRLISLAEGVPAEQVAATAKRNQVVFDAVLAAADPGDARNRIRALGLAGVSAGQAEAALATYTKPWMFYFLRHDPLPTLRCVDLPLLAVAGSLDLQVAPKTNLPLIAKGLAANPDVTITELPGLNHLFQTATTGAPSEYGRIEETMSPAALTTIGDWVVARSRAARMASD